LYLKLIIIIHRDCANNNFEVPIGPVRNCSTQCNAQTFCVLVPVPEEHLKVSFLLGEVNSFLLISLTILQHIPVKNLDLSIMHVYIYRKGLQVLWV